MFQVTGLDAFEKKMLDIVKTDFPKELKKEMRKLARQAVKHGKKKTPKGETGNLRKGWKVGKLYIKNGEYYISFYNNAPHAHLIEDGHDLTRKSKKEGGEVIKFVPGSHMLAYSVKVMEGEFPIELKNWLDKLIKEIKL